MINLFQRSCVVGLIFIGITAVCHAKTAYASAMLILTVRRGPGTGYPVITTLKSDTPLTIIQERNGYLNVALSSGEQGWVKRNYVVTTPPKSILIDQLKKENTALEEKIRALTEQPDQVAVEALKKENQALTQKLETLTSRYTALKARNVSLSQQKRNAAFMLETGMIQWFLTGAGVLLLVWVLDRGCIIWERERFTLPAGLNFYPYPLQKILK